MQLFKSKILRHWAFYDFANSSYVLIFQSFLVPIFFSNVLTTLGYNKGSWGLANGLSTFFGVILALIAGRYADKSGRLKIFITSVVSSFLFMTIFSFSVSYFSNLSFSLFIICNSFFIATISLSDSFLPYISNESNTNEYSGAAWGFGYVGGILSLIIVTGLQKLTSEFSPLVFLSIAIFYLVFSIYAIKGFYESSKLYTEPENLTKSISKISTSNLIKLLIGYWLISEAITVYILFYSYFATEELKLSSFQVSVTLLVIQVIAIFSTWFGGKVADKTTEVKFLGLNVFIWLIIVSLLVTAKSIIQIYFVICLTGLVIGNSQSILRSNYSKIIERSHAGIGFGLFAVASQSAVILAPIIHGYLSDYLTSQRIPLIILAVLMLVGYLLIYWTSKKEDFVPNA